MNSLNNNSLNNTYLKKIFREFKINVFPSQIFKIMQNKLKKEIEKKNKNLKNIKKLFEEKIKIFEILKFKKSLVYLKNIKKKINDINFDFFLMLKNFDSSTNNSNVTNNSNFDPSINNSNVTNNFDSNINILPNNFKETSIENLQKNKNFEKID
jgi:hypothetical protein